MADAKDFLRMVKQCALEAVRASKPVELLTGVVTAVSPLEVTVEQRMKLSREFLLLSQRVTEYTETLAVGGEERTVTHRAGLRKGEIVALLRQQGGKRYLILDRVSAP